MANIEKNIQQNISILLQRENVTERELAKIAGISQGYINKIKNGKLHFSVLHVLSELSKEYGFSIDDFINSNITTDKIEQTLAVDETVKCLVLSTSSNGAEIKLIDLNQELIKNMNNNKNKATKRSDQK